MRHTRKHHSRKNHVSKHKARKNHSRRNKMKGGMINGILGAARTALLPYIMYTAQKGQQKRTRTRHRRKSRRGRR